MDKRSTPALMPWQAAAALPFTVLSPLFALLASGGRMRISGSEVPLWAFMPACTVVAFLFLVVAGDRMKRGDYRWLWAVDTQWKILIISAFLFAGVLVAAAAGR